MQPNKFNAFKSFNQIATLASAKNPIRKVFDERPMKRPVPGAIEKFGRCFIEKSEKSAQVDLKKIFLIIAEQTTYVLGSFLPNVKSNVAWFSSEPIYLHNLHMYHVYEDDSYPKKLYSHNFPV